MQNPSPENLEPILSDADRAELHPCAQTGLANFEATVPLLAAAVRGMPPGDAVCAVHYWSTFLGAVMGVVSQHINHDGALYVLGQLQQDQLRRHVAQQEELNEADVRRTAGGLH